MKNSKTTLMELTRQYRNILKKCFLLNLGIIFIACAAQANTVIDSNDGEVILSAKKQYDGYLEIRDGANVTINNGAHISATEEVIVTNSTLTLENEGELYGSSNSEFLRVTDGAVVNLTGDSTLGGFEKRLNIDGGVITATESEVASYNEFIMSAAVLNLNNSIFGSEGAPKVGNTRPGGDVTLAGGVINVNPVNGVKSELTGKWEDYKANILLGKNIAMSSGEMNINEGAILAARAGFTDQGDTSYFGSVSSIALISGTINLWGTLDADITRGYETAGTIAIKNSGATINGNIDGANLTVDSTWTLDSSKTTVTKLGEVTVNENFTLNMPLNSPNNDYVAKIDSIHVSDGKTFTLNSDAESSIKNGVISAQTANIRSNALQLGDNATLNLKDVALDFNGDLAVNNLTLNGDQGDFYNDSSMTFTDSQITLENDSKIGGGTLSNAEVNLFGTSFNATDSGIRTNSLNVYQNSNVTLDNSWANSIFYLNIDNATITAKNDSWVSGQAAVIGNGGVLDLKNSTFYTEYLQLYGDGSINLDNSILATINSTTETAVDGGTKWSGYELNLDAGSINVKGSSTIVANSINIGTEFDIAEGTTLSTATSLTEKKKAVKAGRVAMIDNEYTTNNAKSTINLTNMGILKVAGTVNSNISADFNSPGVLAITGSNAILNGDIRNVNFDVLADFNSNNLKGTINNLKQFRIAENKSLTLNMDGSVTGPDDVDLNVDSFMMEKGSSLTINGLLNLEDDDTDLETIGSVYATGNITLNNAGLKQDGSDGDFTLDDAKVTLNNFGTLVSRSDGHDMNIMESEINMTDSGIFKERGSGSINVLDSQITASGSEGDFSLISNSTKTGNISVFDSTITLNNRSILSIGDAEYDEADHQFKLDPDGEDNCVDGTGNIALFNSTLNMAGTTWVHSGVDQKVELNNSTLNVSGKQNQASDLSLSFDSKVTIGENSELIANVDNYGNVVNDGTLNGNLINNGTYTGAIGGVTGELNNANGTVNTWGDLDRGLLYGTTNLIKASSLAKDLAFGTVNVQSALDLGTNTLAADSVEIADNATLAFRVSGEENFGKIEANTITISENGTELNLTLDQGVLAKDETKDFQVLNGSISGSFEKLSEDARYEFVDKGNGLFSITGKASATDVVGEKGGSTNDKKVANAWLDGAGFKPGSRASVISSILNGLFKDTVALKKAIKALQPDTSPTTQAVSMAINGQIANAIGKRFGSFAPQGKSGGDTFKNSGLWVQALANKSKLSTAQGFDGKTYGLALGGDVEVAENLKIGLGYAYTNSDIDATGRSTDVGTHTAIAYAEKTIGNAFVNGMATYSRSKYEEDKKVGGAKVKADYDVDAVYAQAMTGYNFFVKSAVLTPETGLRYLWTNTDSYTDSAEQNVKADKTSILTGVIGGRASMAFQTGKVTLTPELKLAATYDIKNDKGGASVRLANGSNYTITGDTLNRFGVETGAKVGMTVNNMEFSLNYEGKFKKDYQDHTGMINFRYNF